MVDKNGNVLSFTGARALNPDEAIQSLFSFVEESDKVIAAVAAIIMLEDGSMFRVGTWDSGKIDDNIGGNIVLGLVERLRNNLLEEQE